MPYIQLQVVTLSPLSMLQFVNLNPYHRSIFVFILSVRSLSPLLVPTPCLSAASRTGGLHSSAAGGYLLRGSSSTPSLLQPPPPLLPAADTRCELAPSLSGMCTNDQPPQLLHLSTLPPPPPPLSPQPPRSPPHLTHHQSASCPHRFSPLLPQEAVDSQTRQGRRGGDEGKEGKEREERERLQREKDELLARLKQAEAALQV